MIISDQSLSRCALGSPGILFLHPDTHFSHMSHTPFPHISEFNPFAGHLHVLHLRLPRRVHLLQVDGRLERHRRACALAHHAAHRILHGAGHDPARCEALPRPGARTGLFFLHPDTHLSHMPHTPFPPHLRISSFLLVQVFLLSVATLSVPVMLLAKPLLLRRRHLELSGYKV